ncbi:MAG: BlaI/MecI/CopY family transcriptional regulator [Planctomycetaceae bacterium]
MPRRKSLPPLSEAQLELMNVLWKSGDGSVADVVEALRQRRTVSRNTIQTMLNRLERKGWLTHRDDGGTFVYKPAVPREHVQGDVLKRVVETVFDGSAAGILTALLHDRTLSKAEAVQIRRMIRDAEERR